jgi:drug/metabolite transporter (DMT)-like permease
MGIRNLLVMILFNVFWAATLPGNKALGKYLDEGGIVTLRFVLAALAMAVAWRWLPGKSPRGWDALKAAIMGILVFCVGQRLQVLGNALGSAGNSAVLMALEPLLTSVLAAFFLREHIATRRWYGFALGMGGMALLNGIWRPDFHWTSLAASLIFISSFLSEAGYSLIGKPLAERAGSAKILGVALFAGTTANILWDGPHTAAAAATLPLSAWLILAYMAVVCTVLGYTIWLMVIKDTPVNLVAMTIFVQPIAGVPMAAIWLGESLHWGQLWGCLAISAGLVIGLWNGASRKVPASA